MIIENSKAVIRTRLRTFFITLVVVTLIVVIYTTRILINPVWGLNKTHWTLIIIGLFIIILLINLVRDFHYIYFSDTGNSIIFRFYPIQIFSAKKQTIEIQKKDFVKFETSFSLFKIRKYIIVYQRLKKGIAKYPPISITGLSKKERKKLREQLSLYFSK